MVSVEMNGNSIVARTLKSVAIGAGALAGIMAMAIGTQALAGSRELPYKRYLQDSRSLSALSIAVQELSACEDEIRFLESDLPESEGASVMVEASCKRFPDSDGNMKAASIRVEMAVDPAGNPIGPLVFEYKFP